MFCTYVTFYKGNKLPPFYIGHASISNIKNGYRGSVSSKKYKQIWKQELKFNPQLFKTKVLKIFNTKKEALENEKYLQHSLQVHKNSLYINMSIVSDKFFVSNPSVFIGRKHTEKTKEKLRQKNIEQFLDKNKRKKHLNNFIKNDGNHKNKIWINDGIKNKRVTKETQQKEYSSWNIGRILGNNKFYCHDNRIRDNKTGKFI